MEDFSREDRGIFQGIKVPFCLNAIMLAFMAYVILIAGARVLSWWPVGDNVAYEKVVYHSADAVTKRLPILNKPVYDIIVRYSLANYKNLKTAYDEEMSNRLENRSDNAGQGYMDFDEFQKPAWYMYLVFGLWFLFIWSFFAGAINRTAAYRMARDESITLREGLNFGAQTWLNHFLAIFFVGIFLAASFFMCVLASLILDQIPFVGPIVLIIAFIFILVAAFLITLLLAGLLFGFNIISSAIGVDKVDSFDAISRSYSYVLGRPWQTLLYSLLPLFFVIFFLYFGNIFRDIAIGAVSMGMGQQDFEPFRQVIMQQATWSDLSSYNWTITLSAFVIKIFLWLADLFIVATAISYWLSSRTKAYLLLRKEVDGDEVEEMYLEEEEELLAAAPAASELDAEPAAKVEEKEEKHEPEKKTEKKYTEKELNELSMDEVRAIGDKLEIKGRSKKKIIERILKSQD